MGRLLAGIIVLGPLLAGCRVEPNGPTLRVESANDYQVSLSWLPPTRGDYSGYVVERRLAGEDFLPVRDVVGATRLDVDLWSVPEATDVSFRVRALPDDGGGRTSNVVTHHKGLLAPSIVCDSFLCVPEHGVFPLLIWPTSFPLVLERRAIGCTGTTSAWTELPLAPGATRWEDSDLSQWTDGTVLEYRLTKVFGAERSPACVVTTSPAPPLPPASLAASSTGSGTRITFENASRCSVVVTVRSHVEEQVVGTLPVAPGPGTPAELTLTGAQASSNLYSAETQLGGTGPNAIDPLRAWTLGPAAASSGWNASLKDMTPGERVALLPSGAVATSDGMAVYAPGANGPDVLDVSGSNVRSLRADAAGRVHVLLARSVETSGDQFVHAEHDGTAWIEEVVAIGSATYGTSPALEVALDGTVLAAWRSGWDLRVASRGSAGWQVDILAGFFDTGDTYSTFFLAGDDVGRPHVVRPRFREIHHWFVGAAGWEQEILPVQALDLLAFCATPGALTVVYEPYQVYPPGDPLEVIERTAGGWGSPVVVSGLGASSEIRTAGSPYGSRVAVSAYGIMWLRDPSGTTLRDWPRIEAYEMGFGPDGKAWILENLPSYLRPPGIIEPAVLFEEP